jgi:dipeptidyl aminopeptidase/acylaminoacyl peptidase
MTTLARIGRTLQSFAALAALIAPLAITDLVIAQAAEKRAVTHDDYDNWTSLSGSTYSRDGKWMAYSIRPRVGDATLYIREVDGDRVFKFARGTSVSFSNDNQLAFYKIGKSYQEERKKKLEKLYAKKEAGQTEETQEQEGLPPDIKEALAERGMPEAIATRMIEENGTSIKEVRSFLGLPALEKAEKPAAKPKKAEKESGDKKAEEEAKALAKRVHVLDLSTGEIAKLENVKSHRQIGDGDLLAIHFNKPKEKKSEEKGEEPKKAGSEKAKEETPEKKAPAKATKQTAKKKKEKVDPKEAKRSDGSKLVIRNLATGKDETIEHVRAFGTLADNKWLWYTIGTKKKTKDVEHGLFARELSSGATVSVLAGYSNVSGMTTDQADKVLAFASDIRTFGDKKTALELYLWDFSKKPAHRIVDAKTAGIPAEHKISSSSLSFSRDASVLMMSISQPKPEKLPKILPEDEIKLDLWHFEDGMLQPMQAKRSNPATASLTVAYHMDVDRAVVLGTPANPRVSLLTDDGSRALLTDATPYEKEMTWDGRYSDVYIVNTIDGSREKIIDGLRGRASSSTGGRYVIWFDHRDYDWHTYDVEKGTTRNLTSGIPIAFDREKDDRPEPHNAHGTAGWTENDAEILINDEYDIWAVSPETGKYRCITDGLGRASGIAFRVGGPDLRPDAERDDNEKRRWMRNDLVLRATNTNTYATGIYTDSVEGSAKPRKVVMKNAALGRATRPRDADRLFVTYSRFNQYPDVWTTDLAFDNARKLTDGCPIRREVSWGSAELVNWRSDDGVELKGYLVKPDGFDPAKKYPMMVYFYERSSNRIHSFSAPSAGTSPNAAYYVSNGYLWFVPDIVYTDGYPGESCEKAVVSGVQHLLTKGFVDKDRIGAAGHSWGGYQTAHLITRTNIFAAVESGAPVVNMFSAYGGIRWASGMSRQFQYEQTQSRIGGTIWEAPMRYWENSPLFYLDKVRTPVLILHNDNDGAVPWYQGIEFFTAMRRLGKEAYLFNYNDEGHGLRKNQNKRDWTRRMQEYFDHHLKGEAAPEWMRRGVPYHERSSEKIPHAPSYREGVEAGLIQSAESKKKPAATTEAPAGSRDKK